MPQVNLTYAVAAAIVVAVYAVVVFSLRGKLLRARETIASLEAERDRALESADRAEHLAYHDVLTGLPNRKLFLDRLTLELGQSRRRHAHVAVMFIDIDRFKVVNDSLGHAAGDRLLLLTGDRLTSCIRATDTLARLGGDEFALLFPGATGEAAGMIADKILSALRSPIRLQDQDVYATGSIGIAVYPEDGIDADTLMRSADAAMYKAKEVGRNTFRFYRAALNTRTATRLNLEAALRQAVEQDELRLHYQPVVDARTGAIHRMEALVRWEHPKQGLLSPGRFLEAAETAGLILDVGHWTLKKALETVRGWREVGLSHGITVNLASRHFSEPKLVASIERMLVETDVPPEALELEITEGTALGNLERSIEVIGHLRALGVRVSLDDFGAGYSALNHLRRLPLNCIKIDQSFVRAAPTSAMDAAVVHAMTRLAHTADIEVVAEGVETREQLDVVRAAGVDLVQGYLIAQPAAEPQASAGLRAGARAVFATGAATQPGAAAQPGATARIAEPPRV